LGEKTIKRPAERGKKKEGDKSEGKGWWREGERNADPREGGMENELRARVLSGTEQH